MSRDVLETDSPNVSSTEMLLDYFRGGEKDSSELRIGMETEKLLYDLESGGPLAYETGVRRILRALCEQGWVPEPDIDQPVALTQGDLSISLEPGGQLEIAGAPHRNVSDIWNEIFHFTNELEALCRAFGFGITHYGSRPLSSVKDAQWIPRARYRAMRSYLGDKGAFAHHMMVLTATIQANLDYVSEADMVEKMRCAMLVSPVVTALFANSPYHHLGSSGWRTYRSSIWLDMDPERCGFWPCVFEPGFGYQSYLDFALDVPMFFLKRDAEFLDVGGMSFRTFVDSGFGGHTATMADFETHLSTLFPEVRLKRFIEVRSADGGPPEMTAALAAFWRGILYDADARKEVLAHLDIERVEQLRTMQRKAALHGLSAQGAGFDLLSLARQMVQLADEGLQRQGHDAALDSRFLDPLVGFCETGDTQADRCLREFGANPSTERDLLPLLQRTWLTI